LFSMFKLYYGKARRASALLPRDVNLRNKSPLIYANFCNKTQNNLRYSADDFHKVNACRVDAPANN